MMALGAYAVFLMLATALAVKVAWVLKRHGDLPLPGQNDTGDRRADRHVRSANRLTLLGFCLITAGAVALLLRIGGDPQTMAEALAFLAARIGALLVVLGLAHFQCLSVMARAPEMPTEMPMGRPAAARRGGPVGRMRPRQAKEDPLDRVFEAAGLDAPLGG